MMLAIFLHLLSHIFMCLFCIYYTTPQYTFFLSAAYSITAYSKDLLIMMLMYSTINNLLSRCGVCVLSKQKQVAREVSLLQLEQIRGTF